MLDVETIFVMPIPTEVSTRSFSTVSLVIEFFRSFVTTFPIRSDLAKLLAAGGSETGLSLSVCG